MNENLKSRLLLKKADLTDNSRVVLARRYLKKDDSGAPIETPEEMFYRVAENLASVEKEEFRDIWTEHFYNMMVDLEFLPNSPTLMNAGRELQQLSACFVLPVGDSMAEIFEAVKNTALIHKSGGGTGFSFSRLRPKNDRVKSTTGISSGPLSFMRVFDVATETVKQGSFRRGANLGLLRCDHPDILEFIDAKKIEGQLANFNLSVGITKEFMEALKEDKEYSLRNPRNNEEVGKKKASEVFKLIVEHAWKNGEPGIIFLDKMNEKNPTPKIGAIETTNPCGEVPLIFFESCVLGSINLAKMVTDGKIDFDKMEKIIQHAIRFLDNVVDANKYPLPEIERMSKGNRKIGLGVMGFADALIKMGISYNSEEAIKTAEQIMRFIQSEGRKASEMLAFERGTFPNYLESIYDGVVKVRNATVTTIAPTGSISMIAGCSSGIEPLFALVYEKHVLDGKKLLEIHSEFLRISKEQGFYTEDLMQEISKKGTATDTVPEAIRKVFVTAHDVDPITHITIQAAFQKYTDNAVSKTVNFPHSATIKDVENVYLAAYKLGCKGVTVYRDGSRETQVLTVGSGSEAEKPKIVSRDIKLPTTFNNGPTTIIKKEGKKFYLHFSYLPDDSKQENPICLWIYTNHKYKPDELKVCNMAAHKLQKFALECGIDKRFVKETVEKARQDFPHNRLGRLISLCLRHNILREDIIEALMDIDGDHISSLLTAVRKFLAKTLSGDVELKKKVCPECGAALHMESGCISCKFCGWSAC